MKYSKQTTLLLVWQVIKTHVMNAFIIPGSYFSVSAGYCCWTYYRPLSRKKTETMIGFGSCSCFLLWLKRCVNCIVAAQKKRQNTILPIEKQKTTLLDNLLYCVHPENRCWTIYSTGSNVLIKMHHFRLGKGPDFPCRWSRSYGLKDSVSTTALEKRALRLLDTRCFSQKSHGTWQNAYSSLRTLRWGL